MKDSLRKPEFASYASLFEVFEGVHGRLKFSPDPFLLLETSVFRAIAVSHSIVRAEPIAVEQKMAKVSPSTPKSEEKITPPAPIPEKKTSVPSEEISQTSSQAPV